MYNLIREKKENNIFWDMVACIYGILVCNNVFSFFKIGNTFINISTIFCCIIFAFKLADCMLNKDKLNSAVENLDIQFLLVIFFIILSFFSILCLQPDAGIGIYAKTLIEFTINTLLVLFSIFMLRDYAKYMLYGICIGIIINVIFSLIAYVGFRMGKPDILIPLFPRPNYVPTINFRTQGLFLEPSYMMRFLIVMTPILLTITRKRLSFTLLFLSILGLVAFSRSSYIVYFALCLVIWLIAEICVYRKKSTDDEGRGVLLYKIFFALITMFIVVIVILADEHIYNDFLKIINITNLDDYSNYERSQGAKESLRLFLENPFGVGFGCANIWLAEHSTIETLKDPFSYLIRLFLEIGLVGGLLYVTLILKLAFTLFMGNGYQKSLGISLIGFLFVITFDSHYEVVSVIAVALAMVEYKKIKALRRQGVTL